MREIVVYAVDFSNEEYDTSSFHSRAYTLSRDCVSDKKDYVGFSIKTHKNGWTIEGEIHEDWYYWVNDFKATKGKKWVCGNFEEKVFADSKETYEEFVKLFPPEEWDYGDI